MPATNTADSGTRDGSSSGTSGGTFDTAERAAGEVRLMFGGDVMLGRLVAEAIRHHGPHYPLAPLAQRLRSADLTIVNLECAITSCEQEWRGPPKAFYFGAPPEAVETLAHAGIDLVSLANNHLLDFGVDGLRDTVATLDAYGIAHCGAGKNLLDAGAGVVLERGGLRFGMAAFCDHQPDFAATYHSPGIAYLDLHDTRHALDTFERTLRLLQAQRVDWPILSLHWGYNMVEEPPARFRHIAQTVVEMGWKILFGHSAHVFQGIALIHGCPVLYAAGDLVDDYAVDPDLRNDQALLFELTLGAEGLRRIDCLPVLINRCQADWAMARDARVILSRMARACAAFSVQMDEDGCIRVDSTAGAQPGMPPPCDAARGASAPRHGPGA